MLFNQRRIRKSHLTFSGFTLIELVLGFLIFSVVVLVLYSTFFSSLRVQQRANTEGAAVYQVKMTLDTMADELQEAVHFDLSVMAPSLTSFEGKEDKISFLIPHKNGAIKRVSYYLADKDATHISKTLIGKQYKKNVKVSNIKQAAEIPVMLMRSEEPFVDFISGQRSSSAKEEILIDNIQSGSLKFFYADLSVDQSSLLWVPVWDEAYIPAGVRLMMTIVPSNEKEKPMNIQKDFYILSGTWGRPS